MNTQPSFTSRVVAGLALDLARAAFGFRLHHGYAGAVHLEVEQGHRRSTNYRQLQLLGAANLALLACLDIGADGLRLPLYGLGGDFHARQ